MTRTVKASGNGELHNEKTNSLETLKAVCPDGAVLFDGPINTPEEKAKVPAEMLKWLEESLKQTAPSGFPSAPRPVFARLVDDGNTPRGSSFRHHGCLITVRK